MSGAKARKAIVPAVENKTVAVTAINRALDDLRDPLFQAMGIVRMTSHAAMDSTYSKVETDIWTSLDVAHEILSRIVDRTQSADALLADEEEVPHGEY